MKNAFLFVLGFAGALNAQTSICSLPNATMVDSNSYVPSCRAFVTSKITPRTFILAANGLLADSVLPGVGISTAVTGSGKAVVITNTGGSSGVTEGYVDSLLQRRGVYQNGIHHGYSTLKDTISIDSTARAAIGTLKVKRQATMDSNLTVLGMIAAGAAAPTGYVGPISAHTGTNQNMILRDGTGIIQVEFVTDNNGADIPVRFVATAFNLVGGNTFLDGLRVGGAAPTGYTEAANIHLGTDKNFYWRSSGSAVQIEAVNDANSLDIPIKYVASAHYLLGGDVNVNTTSDLGYNLGVSGTFGVTGDFTGAAANFSGKVTNSDTTILTLGARFPNLAHSAGQDSLLAVTTAGRVHTMPTPAGGGDSAYADTAWLHLNWIPTVDSILAPQDSNIFVVQRGLGGRKGNLTFGKIKAATAIYADGYYPAGSDSIDIDTNANYLNYHIMELHNGSGGQSVRLPDPTVVPEGWLFTIIDYDAIPGTATIYSKGSPIFYPSGSTTEVIPETIATVLVTYSKTFVAHDGNWTVTQTGIYGP